MMLTFDWGRREVSQEAHCHFQNVSLFQLGVPCVVFADQRQDQTLQVVQTVVDASASSLLQQRFQSLEKVKEMRHLAAIHIEWNTNPLRTNSAGFGASFLPF